MGAREWAVIGALLAAALLLRACGSADEPEAVGAANTDLPQFHDDLLFAGMTEALERQRTATDTADGIVLGGTRYPAEHVRRSRERFQELVLEAESCLRAAARAASRAACFDAFERTLVAEFAVYSPPSLARFTAYYTPTIDVSPTPTAAFRFPIYALPEADELRRLPRRDIDFGGALAGRGLELYYARSRFDAYLLQVEGGGRVRYRADGTEHTAYLTHAGDNGRGARPIDEYMLQQGLLGDDASRLAQRRYLEEHPERQEEIYASCPWYVFFRETQAPVHGSNDTPLTPSRSLASDPAFYPLKGLIAFVSVPLPLLPEEPVPAESNPANLEHRQMQRFFIDHDEGPDIEGSARFDLFFGEDRYAEFLANNLEADGRIHFLVLKQTGE